MKLILLSLLIFTSVFLSAQTLDQVEITNLMALNHLIIKPILFMVQPEVIYLPPIILITDNSKTINTNNLLIPYKIRYYSNT